MSFETLFLGSATGGDPRSGWGFSRWVAGTAVVAVACGSLLAPLVTPAVGAVHVAVSSWAELPGDLPDLAAVPQRTVLLDAKGRRFATFFSQDRIPVTREQVAPQAVNAVLAAEDADFFQHAGLDLTALARAALNNAEGGPVQGGSTLTQQFVKNLTLSTETDPEHQQQAIEQSWQRKLREAKLAVAAEKAMSKDQILMAYLNTAYFGASAYGVEAAARRYFSVTAKDLTVPQSALLAGLLQSPSSFDPLRHPKAAILRRNYVLDRMVQEGYLTSTQQAKFTQVKLRLRPSSPSSGCAASKYPFYCELVRQSMLKDSMFGSTPESRAGNLFRGGWTVNTALDPAAEASATEAARRQLDPGNRVAAAVAVVKPGTGEVVVATTNRRFGSESAGETEIVYADRPIAPPGSTFKPFVVATALERGFPLATRMDTPNGYYPSEMAAPPGGFRNAGRGGGGVIDLRSAIRMSVNTYFVQLIERTGTLAVADLARRLGITTLPREGPRAITERDAALALGSYELTPIELANAYSAFAAHGIICDPHTILSARHVSGARVTTDPRCRQGIPGPVADTVADLLTAPFSDGGTAANLKLPGRRRAGGKTGTTNSSSATWFAGFTPQYSAAAWVGDPRGGFRYPLFNVWAGGRYYSQVFGAHIAGTIWRDTMSEIHLGLPREALPKADPATVVGSVPALPDLRGLTLAAAQAAAEAGGYRLAVDADRRKVDGVPEGLVVDQSPKPGEFVYPGESRPKLTVVLSR
ncbi:MAG: transglycosylase domain-containing protein [Candidatus Nanopelagicales bacterium]|nr:transglycosylase domain-containing protein [Candidatus Nanopelagicales bacterium]MDZ4249545.1 transglycosylase domain-containing protein [Candidatus Nanopelagicales bacterium]